MCGTQPRGHVSTPGSSLQGERAQGSPFLPAKPEKCCLSGQSCLGFNEDLWGNAGGGQRGARVCLRPRGRSGACWGGESQLGTSAARWLFLIDACEVSEETDPGELGSTK